jgi:zinc transport system substrate-binding protein
MVILSLFCGVLVCGCADQMPGNAGERIHIAVTIPPQKQFAESVGGDYVDVMVLVPPGANPHTYELTSGQLSKLSETALYAKVGTAIDFELTWMDEIVAMNREMRIVDCSEGITLIGGDPHIWVSPRNAKIMVEHIYEGLATVDPDRRETYRTNADRYQARLDQLDADIRELLGGRQGMQVMVDHPSWGYLAQDYSFVQVSIQKDGKEPSPRDIEDLVRLAKEENITVVFASPEFSTRSAEVIAEEIGGMVVLVSPLEEDYVRNMQTIAQAFAGGGSA